MSFELEVPQATWDALLDIQVDSLSSDEVCAISAPVVAADYRRFAEHYRAELGTVKHDLLEAVIRDLHRRADELDGGGS